MPPLVQIPKEITENIDDIKTPSNRVLVLVLLFAAVFAFGLFLYENRQDKQSLRNERDQLKTDLKFCENEKARKADEERKTLQESIRYSDSINNALRNIISQTKNKSK